MKNSENALHLCFQVFFKKFSQNKEKKSNFLIRSHYNGVNPLKKIENIILPINIIKVSILIHLIVNLAFFSDNLEFANEDITLSPSNGGKGNKFTNARINDKLKVKNMILYK